MARLGANTQQVRELAVSFERAAGQLTSSAATIAHLVESISWRGPDADSFRAAWRAEHHRALGRVASALLESHAELARQADQQEGASSAAVSGPSWRTAVDAVADFLENSHDLYQQMAGLPSSDLIDILHPSATSFAEDRQRMAEVLLAQRFETLHLDDLDGPAAQQSREALAQEILTIGDRLAQPVSYEGREADEELLRARAAELEALTMRTLNKRHFRHEKWRFDEMYGAATPEQKAELGVRKLLLDAEAQRRDRLGELASEVREATRPAIDRYGFPLLGQDESVHDAIEGLRDTGGPMALAYLADKLNSAADAGYGSNLNRYLTALARTDRGQQLGAELEAALRSTGGQVYDEVVEGPSFVGEVLGPTANAALDFVPVVGNIKGLVEGAVGYNMLGEKLSAVERGLGVFGAWGDAARLGGKALGAATGSADALRLAASSGSRVADDASDLGRAIGDARPARSGIDAPASPAAPSRLDAEHPHLGASVSKPVRSGAEQRFRNHVEKTLRENPEHPIARGGPNGSIYDREAGRLVKSESGKHHDLADSPAVDAGHGASHHSGEPERLGLEDAWQNRTDGVNSERKGVWFRKEMVDIDGLPMERRTAIRLEKEGLLPPGTVDRASPSAGWTPSPPSQ